MFVQPREALDTSPVLNWPLVGLGLKEKKKLPVIKRNAALQPILTFNKENQSPRLGLKAFLSINT